MAKWALILGVILILLFVVCYGIGYIPGVTGFYNELTIGALIIGIILFIYGLIKR